MVRESIIEQYALALPLLEVISSKWTSCVILALAQKTMRHSELQRAVGGISQKMLTQTLRSLEKNGLVHREIYPVVPPRVEYSLTPLGTSLLKVWQPVIDWAAEHRAEASRASTLE